MTTTSAQSTFAPAAPQPTLGGWAQFVRLVRWELFLARRRRAMLITLGSLLLVGYLIILLGEVLFYMAASGRTSTSSGSGEGLILPGSLGVSGLYVSYAGVLLFMVLAGVLIGSEFSYSTLRLSLARGVGRGQLLAAQVVALAVMALLITGFALLQGLVTGLIGWALIGPSNHPLSVAGMLEVLLYWLAMAFNIFAYALVAVCIGTLSRSVAGAIAGPLVYLVIEVIVSSILNGFEFSMSTSSVLRAIGEIPKYLLGINTNALIQYAGASPYPFDNGQPLVGATHAFVVSAVYCFVLILLSYLALRTRDIVE